MKMKTWLILLVGLILFGIGCTSKDDTYLGSCSSAFVCWEVRVESSLEDSIKAIYKKRVREGCADVEFDDDGSILEHEFSATEKCPGKHFGSCKGTDTGLETRYFTVSGRFSVLEKTIQKLCIEDGLGTWDAN